MQTQIYPSIPVTKCMYAPPSLVTLFSLLKKNEQPGKVLWSQKSTNLPFFEEIFTDFFCKSQDYIPPYLHPPPPTSADQTRLYEVQLVSGRVFLTTFLSMPPPLAFCLPPLCVQTFPPKVGFWSHWPHLGLIGQFWPILLLPL